MSEDEGLELGESFVWLVFTLVLFISCALVIFCALCFENYHYITQKRALWSNVPESSRVKLLWCMTNLTVVLFFLLTLMGLILRITSIVAPSKVICRLLVQGSTWGYACAKSYFMKIYKKYDSFS